MRKPAFLHMRKQRCRSAVQLADQGLCFRYMDSAISLLILIRNLKPLAIIYDCTARFVSDLFRNPEDRFSCVLAHITLYMYVCILFVSAAKVKHLKQGIRIVPKCVRKGEKG